MRRPEPPRPRPLPPLVPGGRRGRYRPTPQGVWLISFTDLMCLLLAFFILKFSMAEPIRERWQALAHGLAPTREQAGPPGAAFNAGVLSHDTAINLDYLATLLTGQFAGQSELRGLAIRREQDRVIIAVPDQRLFQPDQAAFSPTGERTLFLLGGLLGRIGNRIEITSHAEREPAQTPAADGRRLTGWELALGRAVAVARALRENGYQHGLVTRAVAAYDAGVGAPVIDAHLIDIIVRDERND